MCGIAGFIDPNINSAEAPVVLTRMLDSIAHRGPDDSGIWIDGPIALGHRRLSILDLSPAGHQPMGSVCGRYVMVFNGEIYNHLTLRNELEKSGRLPMNGWRGRSDTETLLACISDWGFAPTLQSIVGMFAFAIWDKQEHCLYLARDRMGEKPLYYGWQDEVFLFGSEIKALKAHPDFSWDIDWSAAAAFLRVNYVASPYTIYQGIQKLSAGKWLLLDVEQVSRRLLPAPKSYWSLADIAERGMDNPFKGNQQDAADELEVLLTRAVQLQSVADVPVGAFLSGGIDSSTIVALMQSTTTSKVTTLSIGMPDAKLDESKYAAAVAKYLGTSHIEHTIYPQEALDIIPKIPEIWDEPFADSSQIPTYLVCKKAREHVTVALSGDGGDELFLGYPQYSLFDKLWRTRMLGRFPWQMALSLLTLMHKRGGVPPYLRKVKTVSSFWRQHNPQALDRYFMDHYRDGQVPLLHVVERQHRQMPLLSDPASTAAIWDAATYLPDDILVKVDRASMSVGLETRAPLLDHRIVEFALQIPKPLKLQCGEGKQVLRQVLYRHVPQHLICRPKQGFSIPLAQWLRKELRPWAESLVNSIKQADGPWDIQAVQQLWEENLREDNDRSVQIWGILILLQFLSKR